jgi:glycine/D-amino acid oxidase-like deaminating enzyme
VSGSIEVVVVGAGAFGGWTALALVRRGARVTLVDAWGAGHSRSSSGDETRLIRTMYDGKAAYTAMAARAQTLWREAERRWQRPVYRRTGVLYMFENDDAFATASIPLMRQHGVEVARLTPDEAARRFPAIDFGGVRVAYFEPDAGVLLARASCELVRQSVEQEGGVFQLAHARPGRIESGRLSDVALADGRVLHADAFVFACGPWMGAMFPEAIGDGIVATRQDVIYFGTPAGDARFDWTAFPGWLDFGGRTRYYGMPGNERRGFKVADDAAGPPIDPTSLDRVVSGEAVRAARAIVRRRFPALANQPVVEARVCQYEYSPEGDYLLDRHPEAANVWLVGGGSGHGFKMGPALGEHVAGLVLDGGSPDPTFSYARFAEGRARVARTGRQPLHS